MGERRDTSKGFGSARTKRPIRPNPAIQDVLYIIMICFSFGFAHRGMQRLVHRHADLGPDRDDHHTASET